MAEKLIIDTSVVVKWFVTEEGSSHAQQLLEKYKAGEIEIIAPAILELELINALFFGSDLKGRLLTKTLNSFTSCL